MKIKIKLIMICLLVWHINKYYKKLNPSYIIHECKYSQMTNYYGTFKIKGESLNKIYIISY